MTAPPSDADEAKVRAFNLTEIAVNNGWSFAGLYLQYQSGMYRATFRRYLKKNAGRKRQSEDVSGEGKTICEAMISAAAGAMEDDE